MPLGSESAGWGSGPPRPLATCAILGKLPGLSEAQSLGPDGSHESWVRSRGGKCTEWCSATRPGCERPSV